MTRLKRKRNRGVILTPEGLEKLQEARIKSEERANCGKTYTQEEISELAGIDISTIKKVLNNKEGVDKKTLAKLCSAFKLELAEEFYAKPNPSLRQDWGEAVAVEHFFGRTNELQTLSTWLLHDRCRLITLLGMGGIGKTTLSIKLAQQVSSKFDCVIWKSLRDAPPVEEVIAYLIEFLSEGQETAVDLPSRLGERISRLMSYLRSGRCLILLDNAESLLDGGSRAGKYLRGYEGYGELFRRIGATKHCSCLMLTTREKPKEVAILSGDRLPVRSLQLAGLKQAEEIIKVKGLSGSDLELKCLSNRYDGHPLALKVVATTIQDLFAGNITEFLRQEKAVFGDIRDILDQQFERLSNLEQEIMYWLAIAREPISVAELQEDFVLPISPIKLLEAIESLSRRSLIEKNASSFTQQPVVMEYVTSKLIEIACEEIITQQPQIFRDHALIKATAKDYIRENQIRFILRPVINGLLNEFRSQKDIEQCLREILLTMQEKSPLEKWYVAGNIINLFCQMETDLTGYDFSNLCVWQADLRKARLHNVNFQNSDLSKSVFAENFGGVLSVAFSPDGKLLATGDTNGEICVRQVANGQQIFILKEHTNWVTSVAFSPDSNLLASGSNDHSVKIWDVNTAECLYTMQEHKNEVWSVVFSPDGKTLASGSDDCTMKLANVSTGECFQTLKEHTSWVSSVAFSPDGQTIVTGNDDNTVRLWNITSGECFKILQGHGDGVRSVSVSPDGQTVASGSEDQTIRLWNINTGECLSVLHDHSKEVYSVAFSQNGKWIASGSFDAMVKLWDISTSQCLKTFQGHSSWIFSIAFSPFSDLIASGSYEQTTKLWDVSTGQCLTTFQGSTNQVYSIAFDPERKTLISGSNDFSLRLWDINSGKCLKTLHGHDAAIRSVAYSPDGKKLLSGSHDSTMRLWDINSGKCWKTLHGHNAAIHSVAYSPDGTKLLSGSEDQTIKLWDANSGKCIKTLQGHNAAIWTIAFHYQETIIASGALDQKIKLWDLRTGECKKTLEGHESWVLSVAFSPDGELLASSGYDARIKLWDPRTGKCLKTLQENNGWLKSIVFSPDSRLFASCSDDYTIKLWDLSTGKNIKTFSGHTGRIWSIVFNLEGTILASASDDETIKLWDIATDKCLKTLKAQLPYEKANIKEVTGLTNATINTLKVFGAKEIEVSNI